MQLSFRRGVGEIVLYRVVYNLPTQFAVGVLAIKYRFVCEPSAASLYGASGHVIVCLCVVYIPLRGVRTSSTPFIVLASHSR
jgi:hypothetical protein